MSADHRVTLTFDLFSALIDSRSGAGAALDRLGAARGWAESGTSVYDEWDARNKRAQRDCRTWVSYRVLARAALADTYSALELEGDVDADLGAVLGSVPDWPLWTDVATGLPALGTRYRWRARPADPDGPRPVLEAGGMSELETLVPQALVS